MKPVILELHDALDAASGKRVATWTRAASQGNLPVMMEVQFIAGRLAVGRNLDQRSYRGNEPCVF